MNLYTEQAGNLTRHRADDLRRLRAFHLLDDDFMIKVFEDKSCVEFLLQIILNRKDLKVQSINSQYSLKNLQGRSICLDILALDNKNCIYNIEIQRNDYGANPKRARYNSSLLDANITQPGDTYQQLRETYVIFITENDFFNFGLPIYHIDRMVTETNTTFEDGAHIIYVNAQIKNNTALGKLMHDFSCTDANEMHYKILADRVHFFKEDSKGVTAMCKAMEDMRNEAVHEHAIESAKAMIASGKLTQEEIAIFSGLTLEEIKSLIPKYPA